MDQESDKIERLEDRIEQLEATIAKMLPGRRDAMKLGGAAVLGAAAMSGTASAGSSQVGTIGDSNNLVDVEAEDVNVSDTINGASVSGAAAGEALTSDGAGGLTFAEAGGGIPPDFTYNDVTNSRSFSTTFTNNTGKALYVVVTCENTADDNDWGFDVRVNGLEIQKNIFGLAQGVNHDGFGNDSTAAFFVPDGGTYRIIEYLNASISAWFEAEM